MINFVIAVNWFIFVNPIIKYKILGIKAKRALELA